MQHNQNPLQKPPKAPVGADGVILEEEQIQDRIHSLAAALQSELADRDVTAIVVMTGALFFAADLIRHIRRNHHCVLRTLQLRTVWANSYEGTESGTLQFNPIGLEHNHVKDRHILIIDDIFDSGQTLHGIQNHIETMGPAGITTVVLLRKLGRQMTEYPVKIEEHHIGFDIEDHFVIGYGLDWNEMYRELPCICRFDPDEQGELADGS